MTVHSLRDVGELLAWAARPTENPGRDGEYDRLVRRYLDEEDFAATCDAVLVGAGLRLIVDPRDGAIIVTDVTSPLRYTATDIMKKAKLQQRAIIGAVVLAVARVAYPEPGLLDDPDRLPVFTTQNVVDALDRAAQALADDADDDADLDAGSVEVWRRWIEVAKVRPKAERRSSNDQAGIVSKVCKFLVKTGHLRELGPADGGTWVVRPRFRHSVADLTADLDLYRLVNGIAADAASGEVTDG
jgi:hypothetical protein